jgi:2,4-dienoyl-CoA reductase-like NADH-dependent reductase (Old Yellow Enzyme family)
MSFGGCGRSPEALPMFVRISATDWAEGGWDLDQSVEFARLAKAMGVDLIDVSSGGLIPKARIPVAQGYQVPLARRIREEAQIKTGAVGLITEPHFANELVTGGDADLVAGRRAELAGPVRLCRQAPRQVTLVHDAAFPGFDFI